MIAKYINTFNQLVKKLAKKHKTCGVFIKFPEHLAKQFPSLGAHDNSPTHTTVLYIGEVPEKQKELMKLIIKGVVHDFEPFELSLEEKVSYFEATKNSDGCKIAKLQIISKDLKKLNKKLNEAFEIAGIKVDNSFPEYKPHTTLAYIKEDKEYEGKIPKGKFTAHSVFIWGDGCNVEVEIK
jgi:2'-5' RNA ligase